MSDSIIVAIIGTLGVIINGFLLYRNNSLARKAAALSQSQQEEEKARDHTQELLQTQYNVLIEQNRTLTRQNLELKMLAEKHESHVGFLISEKMALMERLVKLTTGIHHETTTDNPSNRTT